MSDFCMCVRPHGAKPCKRCRRAWHYDDPPIRRSPADRLARFAEIRRRLDAIRNPDGSWPVDWRVGP